MQRCPAILKMASAVDERGIVGLKELYQMTTDTSYRSDKAIRKVMQMPVVIFSAGAGQTKCLYVTEYVNNFDYHKMIQHLKLVPSRKQLHFTKEEMKEICTLEYKTKQAEALSA